MVCTFAICAAGFAGLVVIHTQYHKDNCTDYVEHQMDGCSTFCISVGSHRSQNSSDTSTDILTEQYEHSAVKAYHAAYSQCL